jgi:hypothetical protein
MRTLLCLVLVLAACARETPRAPANLADKYAGTWHGSSMVTGSDSGVTWTSQMTATASGSLSGTLTFEGTSTPPVDVRTIELSDSIVVLEMGPYDSPTTKDQVITRSTGRVSGDSLVGTFVILPTKGGAVVPNMTVEQWHNAEMAPKPGSEPIRGTFVATRQQ